MPKKTNTSLFNNSKFCETCHKPLPDAYPEIKCPFCIEQELFAKVKDYIRSNDVTEFDVAEHFQLPLYKIKSWIKQGRIEYKSVDGIIPTHLFCQQCGESIAFGSLCAKCQRKATLSGKAAYHNIPSDNQFHYLSKK